VEFDEHAELLFSDNLPYTCADISSQDGFPTAILRVVPRRCLPRTGPRKPLT
jgi:hypothetical protein